MFIQENNRADQTKAGNNEVINLPPKAKCVRFKLNHAKQPPRPQTQVNKQNENTEWSNQCTSMHSMKPNNTTILDNNITKPAFHSTGEGDTKRRKTSGVLPLGGGKLRCRDVLALESGRGSCLNPEGMGRSGDGEKMKQREVVG